MEDARDLLCDINTAIVGDNDLFDVYSASNGKRTRKRPQPPTASSASSVEVSASSTTIDAEEVEEEECIASCLILLAQGRPLGSPAAAENCSASQGEAGFYVYQCKTCGRCFPSFQALGGHRTSHRKPRVTPARPADGDARLGIRMHPFPKVVVGAPTTATHGAGVGGTCSNKKAKKVHGCSICGSEFSSGQALGGHMRRHRPQPAVAATISKEKKERRRVLSLDLNLPARSDDDGGGGVLTIPRLSPATAASSEGDRPLAFPP